MPVVKYKILQSKKIQVSDDYFPTAGDNLTTLLQAAFPEEYSVTNGWAHFVVFKLVTPVTLTDGNQVTIYKADISDDDAYLLPSALITAGISHIQFQAEQVVGTGVYRFESENKLFPRTSTSITGVEGMSLPLPSIYVTESQVNDLVDNKLTVFTSEADLKYALREELEGVVLGQIPDGSLPDIKLSNDPADIKARFAAFVTSTNTAISAINDNAADLENVIDRNSYDDYQLWLELYYKGTISHVEADNAKAIMFDGFADTLNVDTTNSNVTVDTTNKKVTLGNVDIIQSVGNNGYTIYSSTNKVAQTFKVKKTSKLRKVHVQVYASASTNNPFYAQIVATDTYGKPFPSTSYGQVSASTSVNTLLAFDFTSLNITLNEGVTYAVIFSLPNENVQAEGGILYNNNATYNYADGQLYGTSDGGTTWNAQNYDANFMVEFDYITPATLITDPKAIPFTPTSMKLYQSVKKPAGTTITTTLSANGGTNYETPTLVSSRPDPKFTGYTEEEYDLTITNVGQQIKLKSVLEGANRDEVEIKRYGLIIS